MRAEATSDAASPAWRNRIIGHADVASTELVPNPRNWRTHPPEQQRALAGALAEVGWVRVSGDTRVDWSDAFALVPSLTVGYEPLG